MIGANLPHVWKSDSIYQKNIPELKARVLVIHFRDEIFKGPLAVLPEMQGINQLLHLSQYGIKFIGTAREDIGSQMREIIKATGIEKMLKLTRMLDFMARTEEKQLLASTGYSNIRKSVDFDRFDKAYRYMIDNFQENISLDDVSGIAGMTAISFCRYFKKHKKGHLILY